MTGLNNRLRQLECLHRYAPLRYHPRPMDIIPYHILKSTSWRLCHLLYLYPFYTTEKELAGLRLDRDVLHEELDRAEWELLGERFRSAALEKRVRLLSKVYDL